MMKNKMKLEDYRPYEEVLSRMKMFQGIKKEQLRPLITLLEGREKLYSAKTTIWRASSSHKQIGIILDGEVQSENPAREEEIIQRFQSGNSFGEAIAFGQGISWVDIVAAKDCRLLFISAAKVLEHQNNPDVSKLMANLLIEFSKKLALMSFKNQLLSEPRLRDRLLMYLSSLPTDQDGYKHIPFLQKDLAQYLNVNKSAFNRELARMKSEKLIEVEKQRIKVNTK